MTYFSDQQYGATQNPQHWGGANAAMFNPGVSHAYGLGQVGQQFGQQFGQPNLSAFGQSGWGTQPGWGQQRQLSQQDVGDVVRQLVPLLPQILGQAQHGAHGFGQPQRLLTQQDVNEVVRQILPILPQIAALFQGQTAMAAPAMYGGYGQQNPWAQIQNPWAQQQMYGQNPFAQLGLGQLQQQPFGHQGWPQFQAAFGGGWSNPMQQRTLTPNDINEVVRQLVGIIPQAIANLQAFNQQRVI
jgi:hypothetical protein